jgi:uncharacterized protein
MPLTGALVNFAAIVLGGGIGLLFRKGFHQKYMNAVINGVALVVFGLGVANALKSQQPLVLVISVILGTLLGTLIHLDASIVKLGETVQERMKGTGSFAEGFSSCTLLYCVGAMAITGSIQGGLNNDHSIIFTKSVMDGVTAVFFASSLGVGVLFSAVPVLLYQGAIALAASALAPVLGAAVVTEMAAAGGVALMALAINMMGIKKIEVANMLPAIFLPIGMVPLVNLVMGLFS